MVNQNDTSNRKLTINRLLSTPIELVWKVWTQSEHIANWWGPNGFTNTISKMEVRPVGEWEFIMHGPDGTDYKNKHIYHDVVKEKCLVLDHVTAPKFRMTATFEAKGDQTLLIWYFLFESTEQLRHETERG